MGPEWCIFRMSLVRVDIDFTSAYIVCICICHSFFACFFYFLWSFGSKYRSIRTGIIYNNELDDFSIPTKKNAYGILPSEANFLLPGKRPQSSIAPSIFVDKNGVARVVVGGSGGSKITTAIAQVSTTDFTQNHAANAN